MEAFFNFIRKFRQGCPGVAALIAVNVAVSLLIWLVIICGSVAGLSTDFVVDMLSLPSSPWHFGHRLWTMLTYMFTHYSPLHLLFNMMWLYWFARMSNRCSVIRSVVLYIGGGVAGGIAFMTGVNYLSPEYYGSTLCGASASVMTLMAVAAVDAPNHRVRLWLVGEVKLKWLAVAAIALSFLGAGGGNAGGQYAHSGGLLFGLACALYGKVTRGRAAGKVSRRVSVSPDVSQVEILSRAVAGRLSDPERLDQLLDKIRLSGFDSLSVVEKSELMAISARLDEMASQSEDISG